MTSRGPTAPLPRPPVAPMQENECPPSFIAHWVSAHGLVLKGREGGSLFTDRRVRPRWPWFTRALHLAGPDASPVAVLGAAVGGAVNPRCEGWDGTGGHERAVCGERGASWALQSSPERAGAGLQRGGWRDKPASEGLPQGVSWRVAPPGKESGWEGVMLDERLGAKNRGVSDKRQLRLGDGLPGPWEE